MIAWGVLNLVNMCFLKKNIILFLSLFGKAIASFHFKTYSTPTKIYLFPYELMADPIKSLLHASNNSTSILAFNDILCLFEIPPFGNEQKIKLIHEYP